MACILLEQAMRTTNMLFSKEAHSDDSQEIADGCFGTGAVCLGRVARAEHSSCQACAAFLTVPSGCCGWLASLFLRWIRESPASPRFSCIAPDPILKSLSWPSVLTILRRHPKRDDPWRRETGISEVLTAPFQMGSTVKPRFGGPGRQLLCCVSADFPKEQDSGAPRCLHRGKAPEQAQKQRSKRDAAFAQRKAERASMRAQLREKYQLPKNPIDKKQLEVAGAKTKLPPDLLAIMKPKAASEPGSIFPSFSGLDLSAWRTTAESAVRSLPRPVQCPVM
ncbi:uncharacterized protein LOC123032640 [Varanus komodoensis]|uniref:uncharacterized protein LOC123032640 n=1 Tax=Varanus komodoensis TaxID=61221 RepID=UPI001CF7948A|nr:uncharacterized protein LOC123032640 [Varanus komodoensis]